MTEPGANNLTFIYQDYQKFISIESHAEAITGFFAQHMLTQSGLDKYAYDAPLVILDNACGNGVVTLAIHAMLRERPHETWQVTCGDLADTMVGRTNERIQQHGWSNTKAFKIDAQNTLLASDRFTHVFTNFGPMLFPKPSEAISECYRVLLPGGVCAFSTWQKVGWIDDVQAAFKHCPDVPPLPEVIDMPNLLKTGNWDQEEFVEDFTRRHNFRDIKVQAVPHVSRMEDVTQLRGVIDFCVQLLVNMLWTHEQRDEFDKPALHENIHAWFRQKYGDGPVVWHWVALVTTGVKPM